MAKKENTEAAVEEPVVEETPQSEEQRKRTARQHPWAEFMKTPVYQKMKERAAARRKARESSQS